MKIRMLSGAEAQSLVDPLYERYGFRARARAGDLFFLAEENDELLGTVRFCVEHNHPMLRSMMVREASRGTGVGQRLLGAFAEYLDTQNIRGVFCLPYTHLEKFYGKIGFRRAEEMPEFLRARLAEYNQPAPRMICMRRD